MRNRQITTMLLLVIFTMTISGQSKKDIREKGIASRTVQEYFIDDPNV